MRVNNIAGAMQPQYVEALIGLNVADSANTASRIAQAVILGAGALIVRSSCKAVEANHVGLRTRNGKVLRSDGTPYGFVGPGLHGKAPFISNIHEVDLRERTTKLQDTTPNVLCRTDAPDRKQLLVSAAAVWRILDEVDETGVHFAYRPHVLVSGGEKGLEETVSGVVLNAVNRATQTITIPELQLPGSLFNTVSPLCADELYRYGVGLTNLRIINDTDSPAQVVGSVISQGLRPPFINHSNVAQN